MTDTTFKSAQVSPNSEPGNKSSEQAKTSTVVEVPYLDYANEKARPFIADHYQIGDTWNDPEGGFPKEISLIENYIRDQIESGEIPNSQSAVKDKLKSIEKMTNLKKEERSIVKLGTIAAYLKFIMETDDIKKNLRRYGNAK